MGFGAERCRLEKQPDTFPDEVTSSQLVLAAPTQPKFSFKRCLASHLLPFFEIIINQCCDAVETAFTGSAAEPIRNKLKT